MQSLKIIGEKIVKNSGEVLTVIAVDFSTRYIVKLDDGKIGYDLSIVIPKKIFRFENITLQEQVESKLKTPKDTIVNIKWDSNKEDDKVSRLIKKAVILFKGICCKRDMSLIYGENFSELQSGKIYGKKGLDIYDSCCSKLGFNRAKRDSFNIRQIMFASRATPEGFAVWMLTHNDMTGDAASWANIIEGEFVYEVWNKDESRSNSDIRVTFAKQGSGEYVFLGVYKFEGVKNINGFYDGVFIKCIKTYKRIESIYPNKKRIIYYN